MIFFQTNNSLHSQALNLVAQSANLRVEVRGLVRREGDRDDGTRDTAGAAEGDLAGDVLRAGVLAFFLITGYMEQGYIPHRARSSPRQ
jgi:hypothetical protein